jgi:competence protein ComEC
MEHASGVRIAVLDQLIDTRVALEGVVAREPDVRDITKRLTVEVSYVGGVPVEDPVRVLVVTDRFVAVSYGDVVAAEGKLTLPEAFETDTGRSFDYPGYLAKDGIGYQMSFADIEILGSGNAVKSWLYTIKRWYVRGIGAVLPEPHASLAAGITVGEKRSLGEKLLDDFRETGIVHIVVLSGYNVTIIAESILRVLARLPSTIGLSVGGVAIVLFALMTGASASIVRASVMAAIALFARAVGRRYAIARALLLAVVGMVLWSPHILVFDPGFQLSVIATIGLIYVAPLLEAKLQRIPERFGFRSIVAATLGTQFTVLPLLLYQTGTLSIVSLPVNLLVLVTMPFAMLFSFIAGVLGGVFGSLALPLAAPAYALLSYAFLVVEWFASLPFAAVTVKSFSFAWVVVAYALMGGWLAWRYQRNTRPEVAPAAP